MTSYTILLDKFSARLNELLSNSNETTYSLADKLSLTPATISRYANGLMKPKVPTVVSMAKIFDVNAAWLMGYDVPKYSNLQPQLKRVPRLGYTHCGKPDLYEQENLGYDVAPNNVSCDFSLECQGDSMIDAGIYEGNIVFVKLQPVVDNGQICVVSINDETAIKKLYIKDKQIILQACNPKYEPIIVGKNDDFRVIGKVVACVKLFT